MAVTRRTLRLAEQLRIVIDREVDWTVRQLVQAWARAWLTIDAEWTQAVNDLVETTRDGRWPTRRDVFRAASVQAALHSATREVTGLAEFTGVTVVTAARQVSTEVAFWQRQIITSQLPVGWQQGEALPEKLPDQVLAAIVERTAEQIESRKRPLADDTIEAMKRALIRGVVVGENPRSTARRMLTTSRSGFNGGLTRAMTIARTEVLDAYRSGAGAYQAGHDDVLQGWLWDAKLDTRTCPSCWAMHGSEHPLLEVGPIDHHCGRCARTPLTRSWRDLGIDMDEPEGIFPDAEEAFRRLTYGEQLRVMGPVRLRAWSSGALAWSELSVRRQNPGWRDSMVPISIGDARRRLLSPVR
jgi:hypothetical protein